MGTFVKLNIKPIMRHFHTTKRSIQPPMKKFSFLLSLACIFVGLNATRATTVIPPTFDELVSRAEVIFQGTVTDVRSQWTGEGAQRHIMSYVTFKVEDAMKGAPGDSYTLRMLGGTVDGETMEVSDSPKFKVGNRDIIFVENNGSQFIPLVGIMHGRFHVDKDVDTGRDMITTNEREPLKDLSRLGKQEQTTRATSSASQALSPSDFKSAIRRTVQNQAATQAK